MKNFFSILLIAGFVFGIYQTQAETITIDVNDNFFDADFVSVNVGDVIHFEWKEGIHTTTSDTVPAGAQMWDAPITSSDQTFDYTIMVAGHYHYFCSVHGQMMDGVIEATSVTGITSPVSDDFGIVISSLTPNSVSIHYQLAASQKTTINLFNLLANRVLALEDAMQPAGDYIKQYTFTGNVKPGVYFLVIESGDMRITRKISVM